MNLKEGKAGLLSSISEHNGLSLISDQHKTIYSVGVSTGGAAEIQMAKTLASRYIVATTIDAEGANFAKNQIALALLSERIEVKVEDISKPLPYVDEHFDFVYARLVLHYLSKYDLEAALKELYRILKPNCQIFVVVRSTACLEAQTGSCNPETGMTTYTSKSGGTHIRHFHSQDSICHFLGNAGFHIKHAKAYDEQLCIDFQRTQLSHHTDNLIEVYAYKGENYEATDDLK